MIKQILQCALLFALLLTYASCAQYYVSVSGSDANNNCTSITAPCKTIQHAFDQLGGGNNSITVTNGTYTLTAPITLATVGVRVSVVAARDVVVTGSNSTACFVLSATNSAVSLENFSVVNCSTVADGAAFVITAGTVKLQSVVVSSNRAIRGAGVFVGGGATVEIWDSVFQENIVNSTGGAIYVHQGSVTLQNTVLSKNSALHGGALAVSASSPTTVEVLGGVISQNIAGGFGGGVFLPASANNTHVAVSVSFTNTSIIDNVASIGGGLSCSSKTVNVSTQFGDVRIHKNNALGDKNNANIHCGGCGGCGACDVCTGGLCNLNQKGGCACYSDMEHGFWTGANCSNCTQSDTIGHWGGETCNVCASNEIDGHWIGTKCDTCHKSWVGKGCDYQRFPIAVLIIVPSVAVGVLVLGYVIGAPLFKISKRNDGYSPILED